LGIGRIGVRPGIVGPTESIAGCAGDMVYSG